MDDNIVLCPQCQALNPAINLYCSGCGRILREKPLSATLLTQLGLYALSVFLPPLGLWPAFKYLRQDDPKLKRVGMIAVVLTVLSIIASIYFAAAVVNQVNGQVNQQLQDYNF